MDLHRANLNQGKSWLNSQYKLTVLKGQLKPRKWYFLVFNREELYDKADVVLTLGTNERQYLFEVDR